MEHLLKNLTQLVIALDRPDIQTADALLTKMLDDQVGGRMLARLLYWFPKAVKIGGWVYKSWRDWSAECALSPAQIKRVHHEKLLESFGISRRLMKANGAPTTHYQLNLTVFLDKLAAFLGLTLDQVRQFFTRHPAPRNDLPLLQPDDAPDARDLPSVSLPSGMMDKPANVPVGNLDASPLIGAMTAQAWWQACKQQLELCLDAATYARFLRHADFVAFTPATTCWTVHVPSEPIRDHLQHRLYRDICQWLSNLTGLQCQLRFEVAAQRP
jgi:hypothetical protein